MGDPKNCSTISVLPVVYKIMEKTIQIQTQKLLNKKSLFYKYQSGLLATFLMESCLGELTNFILGRMENRFHTGIIQADLQKAFNRLCSADVLQKMESIGFEESIIK